MTDHIYTKATWIAEDHSISGELVAKKGDELEIHGKHVNDGDYAVRGVRSRSFFWANPDQITIDEESEVQ